MTSAQKRQLYFFFMTVALIVTGVSCNSKTTDDETEIAVTPALVAVKNFYLKSNDSVLAHLDSVFFSVDLNSGVIFNADSLPVGTDVSRLIPSITFANTMTKAELSFLKDNATDTVVDYLKNPDDSIDFTYPVILDVTAQDGSNSFTYTIKVNVHKQKPDSIVWDRLSTSVLPSRMEHPVAQKTIFNNEIAYCLIEEQDGTYTLSTSSDLNKGEWAKTTFAPGFEPDIESYTSTPDSFYLLDINGELYTSQDNSSWVDTDNKWITILGAYGFSIIGIKLNEGSYYHSMYPETESFMEREIGAGFPIKNASAVGSIESKWADQPTIIIAGGNTLSGVPTSNVWAYDGNSWAIINQDYLPELESPMMARYVVYRDTPYVFLKREMDVWMIFGGLTAEGEMNRNVYLSYDNGVHWSLAPESLQLPENLPALKGSDIIVAGYELSANLSDAWALQPNAKTRTSYTIEGYDINWICPYLYIFGGYPLPSEEILNTEIWRGVLQKLTFTPDI